MGGKGDKDGDDKHAQLAAPSECGCVTAAQYTAYKPAALSDLALVVPGELTADIADAERTVVALSASHRRAGDLEALARVLLRAEATASSQIEGLTVAQRRLLRKTPRACQALTSPTRPLKPS